MGSRLPSNNVAWAEAYLRTKWQVEPSCRLATIDMSRKVWGCTPPFLERGARSSCNTKSPGLSTTSIPSGILIHPSVWPQQICAENGRRSSWVRIQHKVARAEVYLHAKFHFDPSSRLSTAHQRHSQDRTDRQTEQRSDSIG